MAWPVSPSNGQQTTINGTVFQYDSANSVWNRVYTTINSGITSVGTVTASAQPNITSLGTLSSLNVNGLSNLSAVGNVTITGGSSGQYLQTNGAGGLSWATINSTAISNGTSNVAVTSSGGNVAVSVGGTSNVLIVTTNSVNVAGNLNTGTGNVTAGNASLGNLITSNYFTGTLTTQVQPNITSVGTLVNTTMGSSNALTGGNLVSATYLTGTLTTAVQPNITSVGTLASLTVTANITSGNANLGNLLTANYFAGTLTTQAQPNITSVGTLINTTLGGANSLTGGNLISANYFTGVLTTNAQPNITSVGTLANLNVTGNITSGANITSGNATLGNLVTANYFTGNRSLLTSITGANITGWAPNANIANTVSVAAQPNITSVGTLINTTLGGANSLTGGNLVSANYFTGTLTTAAQPNITSVGTLVNTTMGSSNSLSGGNLVSATYLTGTLTTAAQPNITSVGTLTNLNVTNYVKVANIQDSTGTNAISTYYGSHAGDIGITGNLTVGTGGTGNVSATNLTGTLTTAAQPNITSTGTLVSLAVSGESVFHQSQEVFVAKTGATGLTAHDFSTGTTFYHTSIAGNFTVGLTNFDSTASRATVIVVVLVQGATPYIASNISISTSSTANSTTISPKWINATTPSGTASRTETMVFTIFNNGGTYSVLGQLGSYG